MKSITPRNAFWTLCLIGSLGVSGCASPKHITTTSRLTGPPAGKALVNFHRPSNWGGGERFPIFDSNGRFICDLPGGSQFQQVCDPGTNIFFGWADQVSVVVADVAADKVYDVMVDISMGWVKGNIKLIPLAKGDERRARLSEFEKREKRVVGLQRNEFVTAFEQKNQARVADIKRDFLAGNKKERVRSLGKDDCR